MRLFNPLADRVLRTDRSAEAALVRVTGSDRLAFLTRVMSGDLPKAAGVAPTALLGPRGNLLAVGVAVVLPDRVDIECDAAEAESLRRMLDRYRITDDVEMEAVRATVLRIEGRNALSTLRRTFPELVPETALLPIPGGFVRRESRPWPSWLVVQEQDEPLLLDGGTHPASPEEAQWLRIAAGEPRWGREADARSLPLQSGYRSHVRLGKGCYIGQEYVARQAHRGRIPRDLAGLIFEGKTGDPGDPVEHEDRAVGRLSSVASLPGAPAIGLATLDAGIAPGARVRAGGAPAAVTSLPFPIA